MRILGVSRHLYLGDIYLSLMREGHDVRVFTPGGAHRAYEGLIEPTHDLDAARGWVGRDGIIMVEGTARGAEQDAWRAEGYRVVGGSAFGDRLENDRAFGQQVLRDAGLPIMDAADFATPADAAAWLGANSGAYVLKWDNSARSTFVGQHPAGADVLWMLRGGEGRVMLQRRADGTEVGVGAYFDGRHFLRPACVDFEHKRFFPGDLGEMTGEMGTLAAYDGADALFEATLLRVEPALARAGHVGYVNLNCIVDDAGVWPLEFTTRFSNPGFAVLAALQPDGWGDLLTRMADGGSARFRHTPGWCVCIVLTIPPFPGGADVTPDEDPPVFFRVPLTAAERPHYRFIDVRDDGALRAHKRSGHVLIVTGTGATVEDAQAAARARADNVIVPELRYRTDIGARFLTRDRAYLRGRGLLGA